MVRDRRTTNVNEKQERKLQKRRVIVVEIGAFTMWPYRLSSLSARQVWSFELKEKRNGRNMKAWRKRIVWKGSLSVVLIHLQPFWRSLWSERLGSSRSSVWQWNQCSMWNEPILRYFQVDLLKFQTTITRWYRFPHKKLFIGVLNQIHQILFTGSVRPLVGPRSSG